MQSLCPKGGNNCSCPQTKYGKKLMKLYKKKTIGGYEKFIAIFVYLIENGVLRKTCGAQNLSICKKVFTDIYKSIDTVSMSK